MLYYHPERAQLTQMRRTQEEEEQFTQQRRIGYLQQQLCEMRELHKLQQEMMGSQRQEEQRLSQMWTVAGGAQAAATPCLANPQGQHLDEQEQAYQLLKLRTAPHHRSAAAPATKITGAAAAAATVHPGSLQPATTLGASSM